MAEKLQEPACWEFDEHQLADERHEVRLGDLFDIVAKAERANLQAFNNFTAGEEYLAESHRAVARSAVLEQEILSLQDLVQQHGQIVATLREDAAQARREAYSFEQRLLQDQERALIERTRLLWLTEQRTAALGFNATEQRVVEIAVTQGRAWAVKFYREEHGAEGRPYLGLRDASDDVVRIVRTFLGDGAGADERQMFGLSALYEPDGARVWDGVPLPPEDLGLIGNAEVGMVGLVLEGFSIEVDDDE